MSLYNPRAVLAPRRFSISADDPCVEPTGVNPVSINPQHMLIKAGDRIDVGIDWSAWLAANGGKLKTSAWAPHAATLVNPAIVLPVVSASEVYASKNQTVVVIDASGATGGDIYWLINTVVIEGPTDGAFTMPDRTLVRMLSVKVVQ